MDLKDYRKLKEIIERQTPRYETETYTRFEISMMIKTIMKDIMDEFGC